MFYYFIGTSLFMLHCLFLYCPFSITHNAICILGLLQPTLRWYFCLFSDDARTLQYLNTIYLLYVLCAVVVQVFSFAPYLKPHKSLLLLLNSQHGFRCIHISLFSVPIIPSSITMLPSGIIFLLLLLESSVDEFSQFLFL